MKLFFGHDITNNENKFYENDFAILQASDYLTSSLNVWGDKVNELNKLSNPPIVLRVLHYLLSTIWIIVFASILKARTKSELTLVQMFENAPWIFLIAAISFILSLILAFYLRNKAKKITESEEYRYTLNQFEEISFQIFDELGVPKDAPFVDVLSFKYKLTNGKINQTSMDIVYNYTFKIYADQEYLYLADLDKKYAIPLSSLKSIIETKNTITLPNWNKDNPPTSKEFNKYGVRSEMGQTAIKSYCTLEFQINDEIWKMIFPNYEINTFEALTHLSVSKEKGFHLF